MTPEERQKGQELIAIHDLEITFSSLHNTMKFCTDDETYMALLPIEEKLAAKVEKAKKEFNEKWN